ncbi:TetR/AcrR family transcriptional regulator [Phenylobacterium aquaticum]|uniref:TetR/AcrR family transcriptional regulator n=1 Tax=Phenylobacterium aquaticum TaxID=1763816 RepID=UPI0026F0A0B3|nr:TetR/AcrR family transcriptional regulator [Phenylobacterium aquaticum]
MTRRKEFDREQALDAARDVFWAQGYEPTSIEDLVRAMGIGRQSLYDTFGDKHALYLEALRRYTTNSVAELIALLRREGSPKETLALVLLAEAALPPEARAMGCMGVNSICEFGQGDSEVASVRAANGALVERALTELLTEGVACGDLRADLDVRAAASSIQCTLGGLKVSSKAGAPPALLRQIASFTLDSLQAR